MHLNLNATIARTFVLQLIGYSRLRVREAGKQCKKQKAD
jgi:hypothetical protein